MAEMKASREMAQLLMMTDDLGWGGTAFKSHLSLLQTDWRKAVKSLLLEDQLTHITG